MLSFLLSPKKVMGGGITKIKIPQVKRQIGTEKLRKSVHTRNKNKNKAKMNNRSSSPVIQIYSLDNDDSNENIKLCARSSCIDHNKNFPDKDRGILINMKKIKVNAVSLLFCIKQIIFYLSISLIVCLLMRTWLLMIARTVRRGIFKKKNKYRFWF